MVSNENSRFKTSVQWIGRNLLFLFYSILAGALVGVGWVWPSLSLLGIAGLAFFLHGQILQPKLRWRFFHGLVTGYIAFAVANFWMVWTIENTVALTSLQATLFAQAIHLFHGGVFACFAFVGWFAEKKIPHGWLLWPALFALVEMLWPSLYPARQGCLLFSISPLVQVVSIFGISAATFQLVAISGLFPLGLRYFFGGPEHQPSGRRHALLAMSAIVIMTGCNFGWGYWRCSEIEQAERDYVGDKLSILALQNETSYATYHVDLVAHSREASEDCDLIVWPECSLGHFDKSLTSFSDWKKLSKLSYGYGSVSKRPLPKPKRHLLAAGYSSVRKSESEVVTLAALNEEPPEPKIESKYVTAYLISPEEEILGVHDKVELMAGGEYMPAEWLVTPVSRWLAALEAEDGLGESEADKFEQEEPAFDPSTYPLSRGNETGPIGTIEGVSVGTMLCCEDMYSHVSREETKNGADVLICLANGICFNDQAALEQHYMIGRFRALENNRYLLRCGSVGVSALLNPAGNEVDKLDCFENSQMNIDIPCRQRELSLFTVWGEWPLYAAAFSIYLLMTLTFRTAHQEVAVGAEQ